MSHNDPTPADAIDRLRLARTEGVGPVGYRRLLARYGSAAAALDALPAPGPCRRAVRHRPPCPSSDDAARELHALDRLGAQHDLCWRSRTIRRCWRMLDDAPAVIAVLGDPALAGGPRQLRWWADATPRPMVSAWRRAWPPNWRTRLVVVSGLARGIDAAAHTGALRTGRTVAAVAGGLDVPYPPEHADLQRRIAETGAVVTEAPLGTTPQARHFPRRNRIIAGLALGVVVVEAALRSGSLITARLAQEAGRELFAVPGSPLDPRSRGANDLIRQGAHLTETAQDVLDNLPDHPSREGLARVPAVRARPLPRPRRTGAGLAGTAEDRRGSRESATDKSLISLALLQQPLTMSYGAASSLRLRSWRYCWNWSLPAG